MRSFVMRAMPGMITCREFEEFIGAYVEGELSVGQEKVFRRHLRVCRECREYLAAYELATALGQAAFPDPEAPLPDDVPEDLIRAIVDAQRSPPDA
ncbi:MAG: zf-HC2 domain-containing protein [Gammaproteobacteria bacterium]|nr:zf-HC2 domain-containing protein [Gammaproteobacteria bacterium]